MNCFASLCGLCRLLCLVLVLRTTYGTDLDIKDPIHNLPKTTLKELSEYIDGKMVDESYLRDAGGMLGAFAVTNLGPEYSEAVQSFRGLAPKCLEHFDSQLPVAVMADGSTRRTYATQVKMNLDRGLFINYDTQVKGEGAQTFVTLAQMVEKDIFTRCPRFKALLG